jgi:hypothetical protein
LVEAVAAVVGGSVGVVAAGVVAVGELAAVGLGASARLTPALVAPIIPPIRRGNRTGTDKNCQ